ncbi:MAG: FecR domain-containing protein [Acidobacteriaceae bacterium]|nr:FecR domain-containing protein [Acidobacteriaceae bacterium]MBV9613127.1 FecR domain-containing protein [Acidobacteriaceae bacterium]
MNRVWRTPAKVLAGLFVAGLYAMPQAYTISARPGVINYVEGTVYMNGTPVSAKSTGKTFLATNDALSTEAGKAEVLLTPGVFLRLGNDTEVKMISPSLTNTQVEITAGEAMVEVAQLVKDTDLQIVDHGATIRIQKTGLYRFTADEPAFAATLEGKARVEYEGKNIELAKNHQAVIGGALKSEKFDAKKREDNLYAWSKVRDEYEAAASYSTARNVNSAGFFGAGFGYPGAYAPGWYWNGGFNSWAWLPGDGAFFSPFGYGFFAPGWVSYAPVAYAPVYGVRQPVVVNPNHNWGHNGSSGLTTSSGTPYRGDHSGNWPNHPGTWSGHSGAWSGNQGSAAWHHDGNWAGRSGASGAAAPAPSAHVGGGWSGGGAAAHSGGGGHSSR